MLTCGDWLAVVSPYLSEPLFGLRAVERLHAAGRRLPGDCLAVLETRLRPEPGPVDLSIRLRTPAEARRMDGRGLPPHLAAFLGSWSELGGPFAAVRSVWLEFDLDRDLEEGLPSPIPCAKLSGAVAPEWLTGTLLPALHGKPLDPGQREAVRSCLAVLPESARLLYAFSLYPRNPDAVRLEIFGLDPREILETLQRVAPQTVERAAEVAPLFAESDRLHLSLDLTSEVLPRIGIEASFARQPEREPRWNVLFERLVTAGLCDPGKRDAALAWSGYDTFRTAPEAWPVAAGRRGFCVRSLSHVKVVCQPDRNPEAKVYLAFGWLERSRAAEN
ncbi:MAG TPA: hypothetical protein VF789_31440 [Thermoanaerobaculia bacterium]